MDIKYLVVHHTQDKTQGPQFDKTRRYHKEDLGWSDIGYHYLVEKSGLLRVGRSETTPGAHARGYNTVSLGIALAGDFTKEQATPAQLATLIKQLIKLKETYPQAEIVRHSTLNNTECPGNLDVAAIKAEVMSRVGKQLVVPMPANMPSNVNIKDLAAASTMLLSSLFLIVKLLND